MALDDDLKKLLAQAVAGKMLAEISGPDRDRIVVAGIAEALGGYSFTSTLRQLILDRATMILRELLDSGAHDEAITAALLAGITHTTRALPVAVAGALMEALAGEEREGGYGASVGCC